MGVLTTITKSSAGSLTTTTKSAAGVLTTILKQGGTVLNQGSPMGLLLALTYAITSTIPNSPNVLTTYTKN